MRAINTYLSALNGWKIAEQPKQTERPIRLAGGCLLYRLPRHTDRPTTKPDPC